MLKSIQAGTIGTIAGSGEPGCAGDGSPATSALLNEPKNITLDAAGNLYIADSENHLIRRVDAQTGIMMTLAGSIIGADHSSGSAESFLTPYEEDEDPLADPVSKPGDAYVQKSDLSGMVRYVGGTKAADDRFTGDGGPAVNAALNFPSGPTIVLVGTIFFAISLFLKR